MANHFQTQIGFHSDIRSISGQIQWFNFYQATKFTYTYQNFFHPFVGDLIKQLNQHSLAGIMDPAFQTGLAANFFDSFYTELNSRMVQDVPQMAEIDVSEAGPYSIYNWELFFHIPLTVAVHLSKNQRFAEAQRWFHYIFDPTSNDTSIPAPQRYWKFLRFRQPNDITHIDQLLALMSKPDGDCTPDELAAKKLILNGYDAIKSNPFQPHAVARTRVIAYQYTLLMKYLDNLIAWGDNLFMQDTIETINEATQCYVLAANLLGPRPQQIPALGRVGQKTFNQLKAGYLGALGNPLVEMETLFPFNSSLPATQDGQPDQSGPLFGIGRTLYFCVPRNDKLLGYWDTVADRLFKIRHCMNIAGVVRQLALFDPPIDPGMLVKAAAAGIDISSIVSGLNQPASPVRSLILIQKALEICGEVRTLGSELLAALEKGDAEHLALVRQRHEVQIQQMTQAVRFLQVQQTKEGTEALLHSRAVVLARYNYYQRLLGIAPDTTIVPDALPIDRRELTEDNFDDAYSALVGEYASPVPEQGYPTLRSAPELASDVIAFSIPTGSLHLNLYEFLDLNVLGPAAQVLHTLSATTQATTSGLAELMDAYIDMHYWGLGGHAKMGGGSSLADSGEAASGSLSKLATISEVAASYALKAAGYQRRTDEWTLQLNLAARELMQIGRQIISSLIAEQIAAHDYQNIQQQVANAQEVDQFLHDKFSNEDLYLWMQGEISEIYYEYYRLAFDTARKAEQTMKQELMRPELDLQNFVSFNYWDSGRKGLLSGEALTLDVKRMEMAYHDNNKREFELTKNISLRQLDPQALLMLKASGTCQVDIPEWLYDLDLPGHYMRRIKSVALSIPAVAGPYTSVNGTLSLVRSSVRKSPLLDTGAYSRSGPDDSRFVDYFGAMQSIVTSNGQVDSGLFETNLRDERYLPFEGAGAISTWKIDLPKDYRAFDYNTISDVILHIRYTARQGVDPAKVKSALHDLFQQASQANFALLFSLRYDFPTEWAAFVNSSADFSATIRRDYLPYFTQGLQITIAGFDLFGQDMQKHLVVGDQTMWDAATSDLKNKQAFTVAISPDPNQVLTRAADNQAFLIVRYTMS